MASVDLATMIALNDDLAIGHLKGVLDMQFFDRLLLENRAWAAGMKTADPGIFERLHEGQAPAALWIGCCDGRVPAEQI